MDDGRAAYVVLGVEAQDAVHYAMPVRCALYDAANYAGQVGKQRSRIGVSVRAMANAMGMKSVGARLARAIVAP